MTTPFTAHERLSLYASNPYRCLGTPELCSKAVERFKELGLLQAPIVETDLKRWSGFRLDKIKSLDYHIKSERPKGINVPPEPLKQIAEEVEDGHS